MLRGSAKPEPRPAEPKRRLVINLPTSVVDRLNVEALGRRSVFKPSLTQVRDELVADVLRERFAGALAGSVNR